MKYFKIFFALFEIAAAFIVWYFWEYISMTQIIIIYFGIVMIWYMSREIISLMPPKVKKEHINPYKL